MLLIDVLPIIIYLLLIVLLVVAIILGIKLIGTIGKVDDLIDDVTLKVKTLDRVFELVDFATDRMSMVTEVAISFLTSGFKKIFGGIKKSKKEDKSNE